MTWTIDESRVRPFLPAAERRDVTAMLWNAPPGRIFSGPKDDEVPAEGPPPTARKRTKEFKDFKDGKDRKDGKDGKEGKADGASNSVPAIYPGSSSARGLRTWDFPDNGADPDNQTHLNPQINGLYDTETGAASGSVPGTAYLWRCSREASNNTLAKILANCTQPTVQYLPTSSRHTHFRSSGIPTSFPLFSNALKVNGVTQSSRRGLENQNTTTGQYPAHVININNAARNLVEIIADAARADAGGDYPIRIYSIGMGELVRYDLGTLAETSESILKRVANDKTSPDFNGAQLEGKYYYAKTEADVGPAFQQLQSQIIRLSK